jgi:hypothetical protein
LESGTLATLERPGHTSLLLRDRRLEFIGIFLLLIYACMAVTWCRRYTADSLLWFCDVALLLTALGLLFRSAVLVAAQLSAIIVFHFGWHLDYWLFQIFGYSLTGTTGYMFYPGLTLTEKSLSFFSHTFVVPAAVYGVYKLGVPRRAWLLQWAQTALLFGLTYALTDPGENINWMFGTGIFGLSPARISPVCYYVLMLVVPPFLIYLPTNCFMARLVTISNRVNGVKAGLDTRISSIGVESPLLARISESSIAVITSLSLLAVLVSLAAAHAGERKCAFDPGLFQISWDGQSRLEHMPVSAVSSPIAHIMFGEKGSLREAPLVVWSQSVLPKQWSGQDGRLHIHSKTILSTLDVGQIPSVPQEITLQGIRAVRGSIVWAYVASDDFYLQPVPDLPGSRASYEIRCQIGGHGISEYVNPGDGHLYSPTPYNELLGNGTGAVYIVGVVEERDGEIVSRSPYYLVKRKGIRFPDDIWFSSAGGLLVPQLSIPSDPVNARVAFQSSTDPVHVATNIFTSDFFGYDMKNITRSSDRFEGFLTPNGDFCNGVGWASARTLKFCVQADGRESVEEASDSGYSWGVRSLWDVRWHKREGQVHEP